MDVFDEQIAAQQQQEVARQVVQRVADAHRMPPMSETDQALAAQAKAMQNALESVQNGKHAAGVERKPYTRPADPFGFENIKAGENRVRLLKSEGEGAWVIRFAHNPNQDKGLEGETYSKERDFL